MSAPFYLRETSRLLYDLRARKGWPALARALEDFDDDEIAEITNTWQFLAREGQLRPRDCKPIWLYMAGRGAGKTRSAAEDTLDRAEDWGPDFRGLLCSKTIGDVRDVMIEGESGLIACASRRGYEVRYIANRARVEFPDGGVAHVVSSEKPDKSRGYQSNFIWADEIAAWMNALRAWDNMLMGWRLPVPDGDRVRAVVTTTPRPNPVMFTLARSPQYRDKVTITTGRTSDNAENLAPEIVDILESLYQGTRLGRQELDGELLDSLGAVVEQDTIHKFRIRSAPELARRIVSLDPSITAKEESDAAGIIVLGCDDQGPPDAYVLDDRTLETATFAQWARASVEAFIAWDCDCVVAEVNQGGGGIVEAIQTQAEALSRELGREIVVPVRSVWARESKKARAEPIGALYERGRIHHVGYFQHLERELTSWVPGMDSPNRMDALVQGAAHLLLGDRPDVGPISSYF